MSLNSHFARVKLNNLPPSVTEQENRTLFNGFPLCGQEVSIKHGYGFVWLFSKDEAQRAVRTLDQGLLQG